MRQATILLLLYFIGAGPLAAQSAEDVFQQALVMERTQGDLVGAIALYESVVDSATDRGLAAQALVRIGQNYERLGRDGAGDAYRRLLDSFGDFEAMAIQAKEGLARVSSADFGNTAIAQDADRSPGNRQILDTGQPFSFEGGGLSPDGRYLVSLSWDPPGVTYIEVSSGAQTTLPIERDGWGEGAAVLFSPDGEEIVVDWRTYGPETSTPELLRVNLKTGETAVLLDAKDYLRERGVESPHYLGVWPYDWNEGGTEILAWVSAESEYGKVLYGDFVMVRLDGTQARRVVGGVQAAGFPGGLRGAQACLSDDGNSLLMDVVTGDTGSSSQASPPPDPLSHVRRVDLRSNTAETWRRSGSGDTKLLGCVDGGVLYATSGFGSQAIRIAKETDPDGSDDPELQRVGDQAQFGTPSRRGDLPVRPDTPKMALLLFDVDSGGLGPQIAELEDKFVFRMDWSPDGRSLAWSSAGLPHLLKILTPEAQAPRIFEFPSSSLVDVRWDLEDQITIEYRARDAPGQNEGLSRLRVLDLASGEINLPPIATANPNLDFKGLRSSHEWIVGTNTEEGRCLQLFDELSGALVSLYCLEADYVGGGWRLSPDRSRFLRFLMSADGTGVIAIVDLDSPGTTEIIPVDNRGQRFKSATWATNDELIVSWGDFNLSSIAFLNLNTKEYRPFFPEVLLELRPNKVALSPDGQRLMVFAYQKDIDPGLTTIIRNLADQD